MILIHDRKIKNINAKIIREICQNKIKIDICFNLNHIFMSLKILTKSSLRNVSYLLLMNFKNSRIADKA